VENNHRPRIADMGKVVNRRTADIHAHVRGIERREDAFLAAQRIVELKVHNQSPARLRAICSLGFEYGAHAFARTLAACWPGVSCVSMMRKRRPQPAFDASE